MIGGGVARIGKPLFSKIKETIQHYTINPSIAAKIPILPAQLQQNVGIFGEASLFLNDRNTPGKENRKAPFVK